MEEQEEGMTKDEMQRLIDEEMASGKSYEEALKSPAPLRRGFLLSGFV